MTHKAITAVFAFAAVAALIAGLSAIDSPGLAREKRLDDRRRSDLVSIDYAIERYYRAHDALPERLEDTDLGTPPRDPETGGAYRYEIVGAGYRLCATFRHPGGPGGSPVIVYRERDFRQHEAGEHCFMRSPPQKDAP